MTKVFGFFLVKIVCEVKRPWLDNLGRSHGVGNERVRCLELSLDAAYCRWTDMDCKSAARSFETATFDKMVPGGLPPLNVDSLLHHGSGSP